MAMTATDQLIPRQQRVRRTRPDLLAGLGGLVFVALLIAQNVIRSGAPGFDAAPVAVSSYFEHHRAAAVVPLGLFPLGLVALACFVSGIWTMSRGEEDRWWAHAGTFGAAGVAGLFALVNITEIALASRAHELAGSPGVVRALWAVHAGAFGLDLAAIAVALVGLSRAAHTSGLIRDWTAWLAWPGAACLLVTSVFTVALADGGSWLPLGLVGFVIWGIFVVVASSGFLRR